MMFRDLLVHVDGTGAGRDRVRLALDLASRTGAHVTGLHVLPPPEASPVYRASALPAAERAIALDLIRDARAAAAAFHEEIATRAPDATWTETEGDVVAGICDEGRYADLVILGQYEWQEPPERHPLPVAASVVERCGRPVLVVPAGCGALGQARAAVAWDGSREAVRAVHDAIPLLAQSQAVEIVTIGEPADIEDENDGRRLAAHLTRHGVKLSGHRRWRATSDEQGALRRELEAGPYDLLVMGGYSRSPWVEFVLGGATQSILLSSNTPILISH